MGLLPYEEATKLAERDTHVLDSIKLERIRQEMKFGPQNDKTIMFWLATIMEELGECAAEAQQIEAGDERRSDLVMELVQVAALAMRLIGKIERGELKS